MQIGTNMISFVHETHFFDRIGCKSIIVHYLVGHTRNRIAT